MIAIVTALREELAPLLRRATIERVVRLGKRRCHVGTLMGKPVVLMVGGDGIAKAGEAVSLLLQRFEVSLLVGAGIAGGVDPDLRSGDIVVASSDARIIGRRAVITTVDRLLTSVEAKRALAASGTQAIDTESEGWTRAASKFGVPCVVVRAIFDPVDEEIPSFVTTDRPAVVRHALVHPKAIPVLMQMRERLRKCSESLANFVIDSIIAPESRLEVLLRQTSRTFALCIPLLPDTARQQVTIAYLLFRIADTFEDASHWPVADRLSALEAFCAMLRSGSRQEAQRLATECHAKGPSPHAGYTELIAEIPLVIDAFMKLPPEAIDVIRNHVIRSARGMAKFVAMTDNGNLRLADMPQLRAYCYAVAGIVGEMLTELFLLRAPQLRNSASLLRARAATFGEGLQLVNILKDSPSDVSEGRTYIPAGADRAEIIALARADLESATEYTLALQSGGAPHGIIKFAALPVALAQATLDRMEKSSAATKIARPLVFRISRQVNQSVARGEPPLRSRTQNPSGFARMRSIFSTTR